MDLNFLEDLEEDLPVPLMLQRLEREEIDPMDPNLMNNNLSTIELVLRANPMLMTCDLYLSVFYQASKHNNISMLRFLIEENNYIKRLGLSVEDLFITAICVKEVRILPYLLTALSQQGNISVHSLLLLSIHQACNYSSFKIVMFLINAFPGDKREILDAKDNHQRTPLHFAVLQYQNQCLSLRSAYLTTQHQEDDIDPLLQYQQQDPFTYDISAPDTHDTWKLVEFLVNANVDINAQDSEGNTPIHHLFYDGCTRVLHLLVSHGGELEIGDNDGNTCLHKAADKNQLEIVKYIIEEKQFVVDVRNNEGSTPLLMAISNRHIELTRYLLRQNASVNAKNIRKYNPLHAACNNASVEITSELIDKYNADIHAKTIAGFSPLHFACSGCEERRSLVQLLLHRDTSVEAQDSIGRTSLILAASRGNSDIVQLLLSHSANPLVEDRLGNNLIHMTPSLKVIRILVGEDDTHDRSQRFLAYTLLTKTNNSGDSPIQAAKRRDTFRTINPFLQKMRYRYLQSFTVNPIAVGSALRFKHLLTPVQLFFADRMLSLIQKLGFLEEVAYAILGYLSPLDVMRVM